MPSFIQFRTRGPIYIPPRRIRGGGLPQNVPDIDSYNKFEQAKPDAQKIYAYDENRKRVVEEKDKASCPQPLR